MAASSVYLVVAIIAAILGVIGGRVFAIEGGRGIMAILAASYVAAGCGLMSATLIAPFLALLAELTNEGSGTWFDTMGVAGMSLFWGTLGGAVGGLLVGCVIALIPARYLN